ncbi:MAG TPA: hypothetical protein VHD85_15450, partial [Terracidiphilus sp.]|nr:hypothetical protein [Terracidiphilus sp.]
MKRFAAVFIFAVFASIAAAQTFTCDRQNLKPVNGMTAAQSGDTVTLTWTGESNQQLRARFAIRNGQPQVVELAAREGAGAWIVLGKDLKPEFQVTTGKRRLSATQQSFMKKLGIDTPEEEEKRKWNTFWDAPLVVPGHRDSTNLPRNPDEIRHASSS